MRTGEVHWINSSSSHKAQHFQANLLAMRQCGSCTACCQGWLKASIRGHDMHRGQPCHYVAATGCSIYEERPASPCRSFSCGWKAMPGLFPASFRPDQAGFIIKASTWDQFDVFILVSAGKDPQAAHLDWMTTLCHATGMPFFYELNGETTGYGPSNFVARLNEYQRLNKPLW
jgi:hypothetical protein